MDTRSDQILIIHKNNHKVVDQIKSSFDIIFEIDSRVESKCLVREEELFDSGEELIQYQTIVIIGLSVEILKQFNRKVRTIGSNDKLRLIFADIGQTFVYLFTDFGSDVKHLSFDEYLKTFGDNISDKTNRLSDSVEAFNPLESIISGLISGQLMESSKQSKQLFFYEIDSQILEYKFETNRPIVVIGLGSLGFAFVKQLVRIGVKYLILVDNDSVHKYNLRHNLFRESEIGLKKCEVVKQFVVNYDNQIKVEAFTARAQHASNQFFEAMVKDNAVFVSAVDDTESKRFLSKVCLNHCLPLIDVGIDRHMFHIQPIVPHLTETYFTYSDPSDTEYPLCVLKSFPQIIEHCIQWSKTKFDNWFNKRAKRAEDWTNCVHISRLIFEKFFNRKAKQLLFSIPLDRTDENGFDFWSDKQIPHPIEFDLSNDLHKYFLILCAQLIANVNQIEIPENTDYSEALSSLNIPQFCPQSDKIIITDPLVTQTGETTVGLEEQNILSVGLKQLKYCRDDENHLQFIYLLTNLRAEMYGIRRAPISEVNRIYNKIIDCFGSTLSTASAMTSIELIKLLQMNGKYESIERQSLKNQNLFLNLSDLDACVVSTPAEPQQTKLSNACYFTEWDHWVIREGEGTTTLEEVLNELRVRSGSNCTMLVMDSKSIYLPQLFPHHLKRKKQTMRDIISNYYSEVPSFVGLSVSFESEDDEISGPNIKYIFTQNDN